MAARPGKAEVLSTLRRVDGIGPKLAERLWSEYGSDTAATLIADPVLVAKTVSGISAARAEAARQMLLAESRELDVPPTVGPPAKTEVERRAESAGELPATRVRGDESRLLDKEQVRGELVRRWDETFRQRLRAEEVLQRHYPRLLQQPNVTGAHVGFRRRRGRTGAERITSELEPCIRVHVRHKLPPDSPAFDDYRMAIAVPAEIEGIPTDVTERSYVTLELPRGLGESSAVQEDRFEAVLVGGIEIARVGSPLNGGTLGGIVFANRQPRLITNQHVAGTLASRVNQPASGEVPPGFEAEIGSVIDSEMPAAGETGSIDCAILQLRPEGRDADPLIKDLGPPFRFGSAKLTRPDVHRTTAIKVGCETGRTEGIVKSVSTAVNVNGAIMPDQIIVESEDGSVIIKAGDSGSLLLVKAHDASLFNVVGLVHARSADGTALVATHFDAIENRFGIKVTWQ